MITKVEFLWSAVTELSPLTNIELPHPSRDQSGSGRRRGAPSGRPGRRGTRPDRQTSLLSSPGLSSPSWKPRTWGGTVQQISTIMH